MAPSSNSLKRARAAAEVPADDIELTGIPDSAVQPKSKKARTEANSSLFVRSLPADATDETLADYFSQHYPVKHATVVLDPATKASRGFGFVTFADAEDASEAKSKLNNELWNGRRLVIDIAEARHRDSHGVAEKTSSVPSGKQKKEQAIAEAWKSPKLIIRNLPWSIKTPEQLAALFQSYGKIKFADLPHKNGRLRGFGFVTIRGQKNAENAIAAVNGKKVDGRPLAVDFAVDREEWEQQQQEPSSPEDKAAEKKKNQKKQNDSTDKKTKDDKKAAGKPAEGGDAQLNADLENFLANHFGNLEEESDPDKDEDDEDEEDEDDEEDEEEEEEEEELNSDDEESTPKPPKSTDNRSTLFIRNLPFTTTEDQLKSHFAKFGPVRYARVVMDKATDRPAGTGFVCFFDEGDSKNCVKNAPRSQPGPLANKQSILQDDTADPEGKYTLDGRLLSVAQAVSKDDASRLAADGGAKRRAGDKRRLFLLEEGQLDTRSPMYQALSGSEIKMREQSRTQRKKLVEKNPTLHMSLTRLAVRNIPSDISSKDLKQLAREACVNFAKDVREGKREPLSKEEKARANQEAKESEHQRKLKGKGIVRQAKIEFESRDGSKVAESTGGRSRGYGFVEYSSHRWALMGLRWLNGHLMESESGRKQRLIVEFAIENAQVVQRRKVVEGKSHNNGRRDGESQNQGGGEVDEDDDAEAPSSAAAKKGKKPPKVASKKSTKKFALKTGGKDNSTAAGVDGARKSDKPSKSEKPGNFEKPGKSDKPSKPGKPGETSREDIQQKLIARKRLMRKKKAHSRGKA